jgi:WD40 repeat protein
VLWNLRDYTQTQLLKKELAPFWAVKFSKDGRYLFSTGTTGVGKIECRIWVTDVVSKKEVCESPLLHTRIFALDVANDGQHCASASSDGIRIWRLPTKS